MTLVVLREVAVRRGSKTVVEDVTVSLEAGRIVGIVGPNGAGKTTLMSAISGDIPYAAGEIEVAGKNVMDDPLNVRRLVSVASIPEGASLSLGGLDYLRLVGMAEGYEAPTARQVELADLIGLGTELLRPIRAYSHGTVKKLALVASVGSAAPVLVLDEIFNGLDVVSLRAMRAFFRRVAEEGTLILLCSHFLQILFTWCDEVAVISGGGLARHWSNCEISAFQGRYDDFESEAVRYY